VVKGLTRPIDVVSVLQPPGRRYYSIVSINFGLITNLDIGTEHMRCVALQTPHTFPSRQACLWGECTRRIVCMHSAKRYTQCVGP